MIDVNLAIVNLLTILYIKKNNQFVAFFMIKNRCNQVLHLTWDTIWESDNNMINHDTHDSQEASPFGAGDHKAERNRKDSLTDKYKSKITK